MRDNNGEVEVIGDEPNQTGSGGRAQPAAKGSKGERSIPSPEPNVAH